MNEEARPIQTLVSRTFVAFGPLILMALYANVTSGGPGILALCVGIVVLNAYTAGVRDLMKASKNHSEPLLMVAFSLMAPFLIFFSGFELEQIKAVIDNFLRID